MRLRLLSFSLVCALALAACNGGSATGITDETAGTPVAKIGDATITQGELDAWIKDELWRSQTDDGNATKLFALRQRGLDRMIDQRLLDAEAKKRGIDADKLLDDEAAKRVKVSEEEVKAFFDAHAAQWGDAKPGTGGNGCHLAAERHGGDSAERWRFRAL